MGMLGIFLNQSNNWVTSVSLLRNIYFDILVSSFNITWHKNNIVIEIENIAPFGGYTYSSGKTEIRQSNYWLILISCSVLAICHVGFLFGLYISNQDLRDIRHSFACSFPHSVYITKLWSFATECESQKEENLDVVFVIVCEKLKWENMFEGIFSTRSIYKLFRKNSAVQHLNANNVNY